MGTIILLVGLAVIAVFSMARFRLYGKIKNKIIHTMNVCRNISKKGGDGVLSPMKRNGSTDACGHCFSYEDEQEKETLRFGETIVG